MIPHVSRGEVKKKSISWLLRRDGHDSCDEIVVAVSNRPFERSFILGRRTRSPPSICRRDDERTRTGLLRYPRGSCL